MPTYVYEVLDEAGEPIDEFELIQGINEPALTQHPDSGLPVRRVLRPCFVGGSWSDSAMKKSAGNDKRLGELGFTKYVKAGDGVYEKRAGKGPQVISKDSQITASDIKANRKKS